MAMSRDPKANFEKIYFFLILHLILDKAAKFLVEKLSTSEVISQKPHGGGGKHPPPVLLGLIGKHLSIPRSQYHLCTSLIKVRVTMSTTDMIMMR